MPARKSRVPRRPSAKAEHQSPVSADQQSGASPTSPVQIQPGGHGVHPGAAVHGDASLRDPGSDLLDVYPVQPSGGTGALTDIGAR